MSPERHLEAAQCLGAEVLATKLIQLMRAVGMPNGLGGAGYTEADVGALTEGAYPPVEQGDRDARAPAHGPRAALRAGCRTADLILSSRQAVLSVSGAVTRRLPL